MCSVKLKRCIDELENAGDFCFLSNNKVMLNCPFCNTMMALPHAILQKDPLTVSPSIVGPDNVQHDKGFIAPQCGHHFFIRNGEVINV